MESGLAERYRTQLAQTQEGGPGCLVLLWVASWKRAGVYSEKQIEPLEYLLESSERPSRRF